MNRFLETSKAFGHTSSGLQMDMSDKDPLSADSHLDQALADLWAEYKPVVLAQVEVIEKAAQAALDNQLPDELRQDAKRQAHNLAGSVGSFGFVEGARLASEIDGMFRLAEQIDLPQARRISELAVALRRALEASPK